MTPAKQKLEQSFSPGMEQLTMSLYEADVDFDVSFEHLDPARIAILPYNGLESMDAPLYSVAVRFADGVDGEALVQNFLSRTGFRTFVGLPDEQGQLRSLAYTSLGVTSMKGLGSLFIPLLIAALIVLNTMMGAVYERLREIGEARLVGDREQRASDRPGEQARGGEGLSEGRAAGPGVHMNGCSVRCATGCEVWPTSRPRPVHGHTPVICTA